MEKIREEINDMAISEVRIELPSEELNNFQELMKHGDMQYLIDWAKRIELIYTQYASFACKLQKLA